GQVTVRLAREEGEVVLMVEDEGQGIDPAFLPHVFEMFRQGDARASREHTGLGIGLALVQQLVKVHKGSVAGYSEGEGKGAKFVVRLPEQVPGATNINAKPSIASGNGLSPITVLAVDDDQDTTTLLRSLLEMYGATVLTANTAAEALEVAARAKFDVVLSDI